MTTSRPTAQPNDEPAWSSLVPGTQIDVVKLAPDVSEVARYAGTVIATRGPGRWVIVRCEWTYRQIDLDGLSFVPADILLEWFSPELPLNAFATFSKSGAFRGWYANVAHPARVTAPSTDGAKLGLVWHDLYLDLVCLPGGRCSLRDEDELVQSGLERTDPPLFAAIQSAASELRRRFDTAELPFVRAEELSVLLDKSEIPSNRH